MQAYLIVLIVVMTIILLAINIYLLILYIHPDDKGWGTALYCKILVIIGLTLCQAQALMVPLDVANRSAVVSNAMDMKAFWFFLYIIVLIFITILIPYAIFLYQTDEQETMCSRLLKALCYLAGALVVSIMLLFITWAFFKFVDVPYTEISVNAGSLNNPGSSTATDTTLTLQTSLAVYIIAIMSFFGWIFVVLFGGVGLFALPMDMINQFRHRPQARTAAQMKKTRERLTQAVANLVKEGQEVKELDEKINKNQQAGWFQKFRNKRTVENKFTEYKAKFDLVDEQYRIFNMELQYNQTNPIIPVLKLILGIIFFITSILWIIQMYDVTYFSIFGNVAKKFTGDRPLIPWLGELLIKLQQSNAGFIGTFVFAYFCLYMLWCVQKGNIKFGIRIPCCCRFHPMKQNQTWMNSFLFNVILLLIASVGVIQLCISSFPIYTRNSQIYMIFGNQINYMRFYTAFYRYNVFPIAFVIWTFITLIYQLITCNKKPSYMKDIERIRQIDEDREKLNKKQNKQKKKQKQKQQKIKVKI